LNASREKEPVEKKALNTRTNRGKIWKTSKNATIRPIITHLMSKLNPGNRERELEIRGSW
jgi:hypothetical protein